MTEVVHEDKGSWPRVELPKSWKWVAFFDFFHDKTDSKKKLPQKDYLPEGAVAVVDQGEGLVGGYSDNMQLVSDVNLPVIVWGDHTRVVKYVDFNFVQGADGVKVLKNSKVVDSMFGYYALLAVNIPDKGYSRHFKFLRKTSFPLPPLNEQRRIVAKLDGLLARSRRAREDLARVPLLVERYKQAVLKSAFSGELTAEWRTKNPKESMHALSEKFRDSSAISRRNLRGSRLALSRSNGKKEFFEGLPKSWEHGRLIDVTDLKVGFAFKSEWFATDGIPLVRGTNVAPGRLDWTDRAYLPNEMADQFVDYIIANGDILLAMDRPLISTGLKVSFAFDQDVPALLVQRVARIRSNEWSDPAFVWWFLNSQIFIDYAMTRSTGSDLPHISGNDIGLAPIAVPPIAEQREIVRLISEKFSGFNKALAEASKATKLLDHLERTLLIRAFRGDLVPQDPNDEPASALLERLKSEASEAPKPKRGRKPKKSVEAA